MFIQSADGNLVNLSLCHEIGVRQAENKSVQLVAKHLSHDGTVDEYVLLTGGPAQVNTLLDRIKQTLGAMRQLVQL